MQYGAITSYIDVAQVTLYAFWAFFAGLILYLRREDKREGYPLITTDGPRKRTEGFPPLPSPKTFLLADGTMKIAPRPEAPQWPDARPTAAFPGAPLHPVGDAMLNGVGPGAWANRDDVPDLGFDDGKPKIVPLRTAPEFFLAWEDPDPRGMEVFGADRRRAGLVLDTWIDRSEVIVRYLEVALDDHLGGTSVLLPMLFATMDTKLRRITVPAILAADFAAVPALKQPHSISFLEEDRITAYYGGGLLYATPRRTEPLL
jgi:photosynthetic reaction center H subunit